MHKQIREAWEDLEELVQTRDLRRVDAFLRELPAGEIVRVLSRLEEHTRTELFSLLAPLQAAHLVEQLPEVQAVDVIEELEPGAAAAILEELPSDEQADLIGDLEESEAEAILAAMSPGEARDARALSQYPDDVAGGLMVTEYLAYTEERSAGDVRQHIQDNAESYSDYEVQYAFVTDPAGRLVGVLPLRGLLLAPAGQLMRDLMIRNPVSVPDTATLDDLRTVFEGHSFLGVPVEDASGRLVGIVKKVSVQEAVADRTGSDYLKTQGIVGGEEVRTMPLSLRARRRLSWLTVNIFLNVLAASVIAFYEDTIASVIALAVFLPVISDMSGCSGNQAVAVSMRELSLGFVRSTEVARVWIKEVTLGSVNGAVLGVLIGLVAWLWKGNVFLGLVVGVALAVNTMIAVSIGGTVPLLMRRFGMDPALASGPILTTVTDMCGFFLLLSIAAALLPRLVGV